jgi:hypothetical protein
MRPRLLAPVPPPGEAACGPGLVQRDDRPDDPGPQCSGRTDDEGQTEVKRPMILDRTTSNRHGDSLNPRCRNRSHPTLHPLDANQHVKRSRYSRSPIERHLLRA